MAQNLEIQLAARPSAGSFTNAHSRRSDCLLWNVHSSNSRRAASCANLLSFFSGHLQTQPKRPTRSSSLSTVQARLCPIRSNNVRCQAGTSLSVFRWSSSNWCCADGGFAAFWAEYSRRALLLWLYWRCVPPWPREHERGEGGAPEIPYR